MSFDVDLSKYQLPHYPDYRKGQPPDLLKLHEVGYLDEYAQTWGQPWGAMGIGKLRQVGLCKPTDWENQSFFTQDPDFFLLRYKRALDMDEMRRSHDTYAELLTQQGVEIKWMEYQDPIGTYGPMRKLFVIEEVRVVRGGAIIPRFRARIVQTRA